MSTILTDDELPPMPDGTHPQSMLGQMLRKYADAREAAVLAKLREQEPVVEFMGRRRTPEGTRECWGILICDDMQDPEKGAKLYIHPAAMPSEGSSQWRDVMPGGKMTDKWESSRVADYNQGWNDYRRAALRNLESAAPQQADRQRVPDGWIETSKAMPPSGQVVLAYYKNKLGNTRRIRAQWVAAKTSEASIDSDCGEYDEATDTYYDPEGWYECIDNWDCYSSVFVSAQITHWMPLPAAPGAAPEATAQEKSNG